MECSNCGAEIANNLNFCPKCGEKVKKSKCPECGAELKDNVVTFCPNCGFNLKSQDSGGNSSTGNNNTMDSSFGENTSGIGANSGDDTVNSASNKESEVAAELFGGKVKINKTFNEHPIASGIAVCCIALVILAIIGGALSPDSNTSSSSDYSYDDSYVSNISDDSSSDDSSSSSDKTYYAGTYKVGDDIPAGEYKFTQTNSYGGYVERATDTSGDLDSIISNEATTESGSTVYVTVEDGEYLTIEGGEMVSSSASSSSTQSEYTDGTYKVGTDIPAGEYKFTQTSDFGGYIERASDSSMEFDSIIANDATSDKGETSYVTIKNGEYLKISGGTLVKA